MKSIAEVLRNKPHGAIYSVSPEALLLDAVKLMADKRIGTLMVMSGDRLVGIVSERDLVYNIEQLQQSNWQTRVSDVMNADVTTVGPRESVQQCLQLMSDKRLRYLPVLAEGELIGLLSMGDLVKAIIGEQARLIEQLESYIRGA